MYLYFGIFELVKERDKIVGGRTCRNDFGEFAVMFLSEEWDRLLASHVTLSCFRWILILWRLRVALGVPCA